MRQRKAEAAARRKVTELVRSTQDLRIVAHIMTSLDLQSETRPALLRRIAALEAELRAWSVDNSNPELAAAATAVLL